MRGLPQPFMPHEDTETVVYELRMGPSLDTKPAGILTLDFHPIGL